MQIFTSIKGLEKELDGLQMEVTYRGKIWVWNHIEEIVRNYSGNYIIWYLCQG